MSYNRIFDVFSMDMSSNTKCKRKHKDNEKINWLLDGATGLNIEVQNVYFWQQNEHIKLKILHK